MAGNRNRTAGHAWERMIAGWLRGMGFKDALCSREASRLRDNQKVDLCNGDEDKNGRLPYNIQAKCLSTTAAYPKLLAELTECNGRDRQINVVFHRQTERTEQKNRTIFKTKDDFAILYLNDFMDMMKMCEAFKVQNDYMEFVPDDEKVRLEERLKEIGV